jgi:hypothetical protein
MAHHTREWRRQHGKATTPPANQGTKPAIDKKTRSHDEQQAESPQNKTPSHGVPAGYIDNKGDSDPKRAKEDARASDNKQNPPLTARTKTIRRCKLIGGALMIVLTAVMAGANVIYAILGVRQLSIMSGQLKQMKTDSESSSIATDRQLAIMEGQLKQMQEASQLEQRAWVGLARASHTKIVRGTKKIGVEFRFINTGKTPAIIESAGRTLCVRKSDCDMEAMANTQMAAWMSETRSRGPLAPNAGFTMDPSIEVNSDSGIEAIRSGNARVFMVGRIAYRDFFGKEHETKFCYYVLDPCDVTMTEHHQYNYMD